MRRSVAQKYIKTLYFGRRPFIIADVMLYIEIAQAFSAENTIKQELF
jgi:hypothetical protein